MARPHGRDGQGRRPAPPPPLPPRLSGRHTRSIAYGAGAALNVGRYMRVRRPVATCLAAALLCGLGCGTERLAPPAPKLPEDIAVYGRLPSLEAVAISPDG